MLLHDAQRPEFRVIHGWYRKIARYERLEVYKCKRTWKDMNQDFRDLWDKTWTETALASSFNEHEQTSPPQTTRAPPSQPPPFDDNLPLPNAAIHLSQNQMNSLRPTMEMSGSEKQGFIKWVNGKNFYAEWGSGFVHNVLSTTCVRSTIRECTVHRRDNGSGTSHCEIPLLFIRK